MTLQEWSKAIANELVAAGFVATLLHGFPCVAMPETQEGRVKLLELELSMPTERTIFAEGMLFFPKRVL